jgi:hypothetical protein
MIVRVWPENTYEELGAKRWCVEWWSVTKSAQKRIEAAEARGEQDEYDRDSDIVSNCKYFPARAKGLAIAYAKRMAVCDRSAFGSALVSQEVVDWYVEEDRIAEWTHIDGTEIDV